MHILGIFAKYPEAGRVKSRLAATMGGEAAARLYAAFLGDLLERFRTTGDRRIIGYTPSNSVADRFFSKSAGTDYETWPQPETDLGGRIAAFFEEMFRNTTERIVLIGSDSPTLPTKFVRDAFEKLETVDGVIGPARDGGYYLIGLRCPCPELFADIAWSGPDVLRQTLTQARRAGFDLQLLKEWYDVDEPEDLLCLKEEIRELRAADSSEFPPRTSAFLEQDVPTGDTIL